MVGGRARRRGARGAGGGAPRRAGVRAATEPGTAWTVDQSSNGYSDVEHYRVVARDAGRVTLDYTQDQKMSGAGGFAGTRGGSLVYDTTRTVPLRAAFDSQSRRRTGSTNETLHASVTLTLLADSFAKR